MLAENFWIDMRRSSDARKLMHPVVGLWREQVVPGAPAPVQEIDIPCRTRRFKNAAVGVA